MFFPAVMPSFSLISFPLCSLLSSDSDVKNNLNCCLKYSTRINRGIINKLTSSCLLAYRLLMSLAEKSFSKSHICPPSFAYYSLFRYYQPTLERIYSLNNLPNKIQRTGSWSAFQECFNLKLTQMLPPDSFNENGFRFSVCLINNEKFKLTFVNFFSLNELVTYA